MDSIKTLQSSITGGEMTKEEAEERARQDREQDKLREAERLRSWKYTKYGMWFTGTMLVIGGSMVLYTFAKPNLDEDGNPIEDEFSHLPVWQQSYKRIWREVNYFKKV